MNQGKIKTKHEELIMEMRKKNNIEMPIWDHLKELRGSFIRAGLALVVSACTAFFFSEDMLFWLTRLLPVPATGTAAPLVFLSPAEVFITDLKIALYAGLALAMPVIFYEIWRFVSPGLFQKERYSLYPLLIFGSVSFYVGMAFCYFFALPFALQFLVSYGRQRGISPAISVALYVDFNLKFLFSFGLIFELPIVMALLSKTGILTAPFLVHNRKYAIIVAFFIAAILTPTPDIFNQCIMAISLILLYEVGILAVRFFGKEPVVHETKARQNPVEVAMNNVTVVGLSDVGLVRAKNQDVFGIFPELSMAIVADGMGGRPAGEVASKMTMDAICAFLRNAKETVPQSLSDLLLLDKAIVDANKKVYEASLENAAYQGMGTTVVVMLISSEEVVIGFTGDSRAYLHRDGVLTQITEDHSVTNEYIRAGVITREEAKYHPLRHVISRGVGVEPNVLPESFKTSAQVGDIFLLCTDGLSNMVDAEEINSILNKNQGNLSLAVSALVERAKAASGKDNITIVLARYDP